ncbi:hypothetical protein HOY34_17260 [Xinfangfangia sp. D13-10-4-6]|uniref:hypothetical protein n=1 Tax=Pseudogemmobacter hezensis TaxID=2737662 RepID=UPI001551AC3A|nr:hypothetical protein [Pseudogemmobacter hezensis]NPD16944.1 hypothetical protein [Pseudogemmobacter hezensis]
MSDQDTIADLKERIEALERNRDDERQRFEALAHFSFIFFEKITTHGSSAAQIEAALDKQNIDRETAANPRFADIANAFRDFVRERLTKRN